VLPSGARCGSFLGGKAKELFKKLRKDVLPEFRAPMIKTLYGVGSLRRRTLRGELSVDTVEFA